MNDGSSWIKLDDGTWGVRLVGCEYATGTCTGIPFTVKTRAGKKTRVVLGEHVRTFRVERGKFVDIYRVAPSA